MKVSMFLLAFIVANTLNLSVSIVPLTTPSILSTLPAVPPIGGSTIQFGPFEWGVNDFLYLVHDVLGIHVVGTPGNFQAIFGNDTCTNITSAKSALCTPGLVSSLACDEHCRYLHGTKNGSCSAMGYCSCCDELDSSGQCVPICCTTANQTDNGPYNYTSIVQIGLCNPCSGQKFCQLDCIGGLHDPDISNNNGQGCCNNRKCYCTLPTNCTNCG